MAAEATVAGTEINRVTALFQSLRASESTSEEFATTIVTLADLSRTSSSVRNALADHQAIDHLVKALETRGLSAPTAVSVMRCLGNACVGDDEDGNEETAIYIANLGFRWVHALGPQEESNGMAIRVLHNLFTLAPSDASKQAANIALDTWLIDVLAASLLPASGEDVTYAFTVLSAIYNRGAQEDSRTLSAERSALLLSLARQYALDPVHGVMTVARLAGVSGSVFGYFNSQKQQVVEFGLQLQVWDLFVLVDRLMQAPEQARDAQSEHGEMLRRDLVQGDGSLWDASMVFLKPDTKLLSAPASDGTMDAAKLMQRLLLSFVWLLSDLATCEGFAPDGVENTLVKTVVRHLARPPLTSGSRRPRLSPYRLIAGCQLLSNVLRTDAWKSAAPLVQRDRLHTYLINDLLQTDHDEYLHAGSFLLCLLARPSLEVREELALTPGMPAVCARLAKHPDPQLRNDAGRLILALGKDSASVQKSYRPLLLELRAFEKTHRAVAEKQEE